MKLKTVNNNTLDVSGWAHWRLDHNADGTVKLTAYAIITEEWAQYLRDCCSGESAVRIPNEMVRDIIQKS